jgi:toxin FitB
VNLLVDANVLSEATKERPASTVVDWLGRHETDLVVNPIILGELRYGVLLLPSGRRRARLLHWYSQGIRHLRVMDMDFQTGEVWAELLATLKRKGRAMPLKDSLIAATALQHQLTVATRNLGDYRYAGVKVVDPFEAT